MIKQYISPEIIEACSSMKWESTIRITHLKRNDGSICSEGKDAACSITKTPYGWSWYCFRCKEYGVIPLKNRSPEDTLQALQKGEIDVKLIKSTKEIELPKDFIPMVSSNVDRIPEKAFKWPYSYNIDDLMLKRWGFGWSNIYNRVIIPVFDSIKKDNYYYRKLIGWVGRNVDEGDNNSPKSITKKDPSIDRLLFKIKPRKSKSRQLIVIVEDVISAIKVFQASGVYVVALLNNFIPERFILDNLDKKILYWLDDGQQENMFKAVQRFNQLGSKSTCIWTLGDPKDYNYKRINLMIRRKSGL